MKLEIAVLLAQQTIAIQNLTRELQQTRDALEKLARVAGLEYSQDLQDWLAKGKLDELRHAPR